MSDNYKNMTPKGNCDICNRLPAKYWFGDTSVALCGNEYCKNINQGRWERMLEEINEEQQYD